MKVSDELLRKVCGILATWDPDIVEVVQFGSSVYMPEHARDLDLLVFTKERKDYGLYLDAACEVYDELGFPYNIDVIPHEVGKPLKESFAVQVRGAYRVLYGSGKHFREATDWAVAKLARELGVNPTFEEARICIHGVEGAASVFGRAREAKSEGEQDSCVRLAFNRLFDAARIASIAYLSTEETRWGRMRRRLPKPYREVFDDVLRVLHVKYFYEGIIPARELRRSLEGGSGRLRSTSEDLRLKLGRHRDGTSSPLHNLSCV